MPRFAAILPVLIILPLGLSSAPGQDQTTTAPGQTPSAQAPTANGLVPTTSGSDQNTDGPDQNTDGPIAATPPPTAAPAPSATSDAAPDARPSLPPLWQVYYDRGMKAMRAKDFRPALEELGKAKAELAKYLGPDKRKLLAEINTQLGVAFLELGKADKNIYTRESHLTRAKHRFAWARDGIAALHGRDTLEYADATERLADARSTYAKHRAGDLRYFLSALGADFTTKETAADLYLFALHLREQNLGESAKEVMTYRRKVRRTLYGWVRTARNLRKDITDVKAEYDYDPIIAGWKERADELKQRDRDLKRRIRDNSSLDNPNPDDSGPDDSSTNGNEWAEKQVRFSRPAAWRSAVPDGTDLGMYIFPSVETLGYFPCVPLGRWAAAARRPTMR